MERLILRLSQDNASPLTVSHVVFDSTGAPAPLEISNSQLVQTMVFTIDCVLNSCSFRKLVFKFRLAELALTPSIHTHLFTTHLIDESLRALTSDAFWFNH